MTPTHITMDEQRATIAAKISSDASFREKERAQTHEAREIMLKYMERRPDEEVMPRAILSACTMQGLWEQSARYAMWDLISDGVIDLTTGGRLRYVEEGKRRGVD